MYLLFGPALTSSSNTTVFGRHVLRNIAESKADNYQDCHHLLQPSPQPSAAPLRLILMSQRFKRQEDAGNQFNPEQPEDGSLNATADNAEGMEEVEEQEGYSTHHLFHPFVAQSEQLTRSLVLRPAITSWICPRCAIGVDFDPLFSRSLSLINTNINPDMDLLVLLPAWTRILLRSRGRLHRR